MSTSESVLEAAAEPVTPSPSEFDGFASLAGFIARTSTGDQAALSRLDPAQIRPHQMAALVRALTAAGIHPEQWPADVATVLWQRWALITHGVALAGHDGRKRLGAQMAHAGVAESRVTKLLTARGEAFTALLPRLLRLMASKGVAPNWHELGALILKESASSPVAQEEAHQLRLRIAGAYFSAVAAST